MGIYDREYYRTGARGASGLGRLRFVSFNTWIIVANVAVFLVGLAVAKQVTLVQTGKSLVYPGTTPQQLQDAVVDRDPDHLLPVPGRQPAEGQPLYVRGTGQAIGVNLVIRMDPLTAWGHFSTNLAFLHLEVWRFITFQFLHSGFTHILFNMFGLFVFGGMVEQALGSKRYVAFYLVCGVFGAISYMVLNLLGQTGLHLPGLLFEETYMPLVGASAGVFGVIIACAYIAPNAVVQLLFPPIPLRLKWFAYGYVALAAWNLFWNNRNPGSNAGGDAAHLGGAAAGFFFIRNSHLLRDFFDIVGDSRRPGRAGAGDAGRQEIDRILSKVSTQGLQSLSDAEKTTLRRAGEARRDG
ncbi:MAG: rhomboid family intramembrane serine protease [Phycisphaerales bacterium]|nr:rhomboid family intramembrane serine protease [Phycisphaerales bacterium]